MNMHNITAGKHTFKDEDLAQAAKFARYLNYTLKLENVVEASGAAGAIAFGDLRDVGLLDKNYIPGSGAPDDCDPHGIEWTVKGDVEFITTSGDVYKKGDFIEWQK